MTHRISRQIKRVTGVKALNLAVREIKKTGATDIKIKKRRQVRIRPGKEPRPDKYQISYQPAWV